MLFFFSELVYREKDNPKFIEVSNFTPEHFVSALKHQNDLNKYTDIVFRKKNSKRFATLQPDEPAPITIKNLENVIKGIGIHIFHIKQKLMKNLLSMCTY